MIVEFLIDNLVIKLTCKIEQIFFFQQKYLNCFQPDGKSIIICHSNYYKSLITGFFISTHIPTSKGISQLKGPV